MTSSILHKLFITPTVIIDTKHFQGLLTEVPTASIKCVFLHEISKKNSVVVIPDLWMLWVQGFSDAASQIRWWQSSEWRAADVFVGSGDAHGGGQRVGQNVIIVNIYDRKWIFLQLDCGKSPCIFVSPKFIWQHKFDAGVSHILCQKDIVIIINSKITNPKSFH